MGVKGWGSAKDVILKGLGKYAEWTEEGGRIGGVELASCPGNASGEQQTYITYSGTVVLRRKYTTSIHDFQDLSSGNISALVGVG